MMTSSRFCSLGVTTPVWKRFQAGMPNTRVRFLALDRGANGSPKASTTLGAFTYGRGLFVTKLSLSGCTAPVAPTTATWYLAFFMKNLHYEILYAFGS